jgi:hypothetical protein
VWVGVKFPRFKFAPTRIKADIIDKCSRSPDLFFQMESNQAPDRIWRPGDLLIFSFPEPPGVIPDFRLSMRPYLSQTADMVDIRMYTRSEFTGHSSDITFFRQLEGRDHLWQGIQAENMCRSKTVADGRGNGRQIPQMIIRLPMITRLHRKSLSSTILNLPIACPSPT